jgi:transposase
MRKVYIVDLSEEEKTELKSLSKKGTTSARKLNRAHVLLLANEGETDKAISGALGVGTSTVERVRKRFVEGGLSEALNERARPGGKRKLDGRQEAYLLALASGDPPEGRKRWTMQLLADRLVELEVLDSLSDETVRRPLKKGPSNRA